MYPQQQPYGYMPNTQGLYSNSARQPQSSFSSGFQALKGRPVASLDEVRAQPIDFDGSIFFFPNLGNNVIYTKQINMDGTATVNAYQLTELPSQAPAQNNFVTREEFDAALKDLASKITAIPPTVKPEESRMVNEAVAKF